MAVGGTVKRERGLTKRVASALTTGGPHPRAVRLGSRLHLWMLRRFGGVGFLGRDVLVLTTTGRHSGEPRSTPLYYVQRGDGADRRYCVAASFAGRDAPPAWYQNLIADPQVSVQVSDRQTACRARVLEPGEAQEVWPQLDATYRPFARYRRRTDRVIPVIELTPVDQTVIGGATGAGPRPRRRTPAPPMSRTATTWRSPASPEPGPARPGKAEPRRVEQLAARLGDARSGRVVLVSHCLLNENTRYLGGACRPGCVAEVVDACVAAGFGMVQMPCPEEQVWGGVLKRHLLRTYGSPVLKSGRRRRIILPVALAYTRWRYRRLARAVAAQAADYQRSGLDVAAVLGVDGSPSCGVEHSLDTARVLNGLVHVDPDTVTAAEVNAIVRGDVSAGPGMYTQALQRALRRRGLSVPFLAHDLIAELNGQPSPVATVITRLGRPQPGHPESAH